MSSQDLARPGDAHLLILAVELELERIVGGEHSLARFISELNRSMATGTPSDGKWVRKVTLINR